MKKLISALVFAAILLGGCATASLAKVAPGVELPGTHFSKIAEYSTMATLGVCPANNDLGAVEVILVVLQKDGVTHRYLWNPETRRLIWMVHPGNSEYPSAVGIGVTNEKDHDRIPDMEWLTFSEAKQRFASPCDYIAPMGV